MTESPLVVPPEALREIQPSAAMQGHAHVGFRDYPSSEPGHLDFPPLRLAVAGEMAPGAGTSMHPHRDIEILTIVCRGTVRHTDSLGNDETYQRAVLHLSAGSGVEHAHQAGEAKLEAVEILLDPAAPGGTPGFITAPLPEAKPEFQRLPLDLPHDVELATCSVGPGESTTWHNARRVYALVLAAPVRLNGRDVAPGSRVLARESGPLTFTGSAGVAEIILLDLRPSSSIRAGHEHER